jgi:hypothetical protein
MLNAQAVLQHPAKEPAFQQLSGRFFLNRALIEKF